MADRAKYTYRGQRHTRKSQRPGKKTVHVKGYCRASPVSRLAKSLKSYADAKDWGF